MSKAINSKLEAITVLHNAFQHHPEFKKKWQDFIELTVTEEMEEAGIHSVKTIKRVRTEVANRVIDHFEPSWWEMSVAVDKLKKQSK
jgi:hypothetical protein